MKSIFFVKGIMNFVVVSWLRPLTSQSKLTKSTHKSSPNLSPVTTSLDINSSKVQVSQIKGTFCQQFGPVRRESQKQEIERAAAGSLFKFADRPKIFHMLKEKKVGPLLSPFQDHRIPFSLSLLVQLQSRGIEVQRLFCKRVFCVKFTDDSLWLQSLLGRRFF